MIDFLKKKYYWDETNERWDLWYHAWAFSLPKDYGRLTPPGSDMKPYGELFATDAGGLGLRHVQRYVFI